MLKAIFNKLFNRINKVTEEEVDERIQYYTITQLIHQVDYEKYPDPEIINPEGDITVLYMDDLQEFMEINMMDLETIKERYLETQEERDLFNRLKIVKCTGLYAGQIAIKYLLKHKVDKALLDLTLGKEPIEFPNGQILDINGTDVAVELFNRYKDIQIGICTSHTLNKNNPQYHDYMLNFETNTGEDIMEHYIPRIKERTENVKLLLLTDKYKFKKDTKDDVSRSTFK